MAMLLNTAGRERQLLAQMHAVKSMLIAKERRRKR